MTLDAGALEDACEAHLGTSQASAAAAAAAFAAVYDTYAQAAQFGASAPVLTGRRALFESALAGALAAPPPAAVTALGTAVAAYWGTATVPVAGPQTGVVNGCPGAAGIAAALASLLASPTGNTRAVAAAALAGALHAATLTVTATVSPPGGTVLPIS